MGETTDLDIYRAVHLVIRKRGEDGPITARLGRNVVQEAASLCSNR